MPPIQSKPEFPEKLKAAHFKKCWSYSLSRNSAQAHILVYSTASIIHVSEGEFCNSTLHSIIYSTYVYCGE